MVFVPGGYRRTKADIGRIVTALERKLAEFPGDEDLAGGEIWLMTGPCNPEVHNAGLLRSARSSIRALATVRDGRQC